MIQIAVRILFSLFALAGILELFRFLLFHLLKTKNQGKLFCVVALSGHEEDAELILRNAAERMRWTRAENACVVCLDCGMDTETRKICEMVCADLPGVILCSPEEIGRIICP